MPANHTPFPWIASGRFIIDGQGRKLFEVMQPGSDPGEAEANKRWAIASGKACDGLTEAELSHGAVLPLHRHAALANERDELRAMLEAITGHFQRTGDPTACDLMKQARALTEKSRRKQAGEDSGNGMLRAIFRMPASRVQSMCEAEDARCGDSTLSRRLQFLHATGECCVVIGPPHSVMRAVGIVADQGEDALHSVIPNS